MLSILWALIEHRIRAAGEVPVLATAAAPRLEPADLGQLSARGREAQSPR